MMSYLLTIATDSYQPLPKCVSGIKKQIIKTAFVDIKCSRHYRRKTFKVVTYNPPPPPGPPRV